MLSKKKIELGKGGKVLLKIKVKPGAPKTEFSSILVDGTRKLSVAAPPEDGKANKALLKFLAKTFDVSVNNVKIISGNKNKIKLVKISNN